ncbi:MAG: T9SS type A sorting domain-containing protein [Bacteroidota bacterium]
MKRIFLLCCFCLGMLKGFSQTYTISQDYMNAVGDPGDLMLDTARLTNTSSAPINIYIIRILASLPPNWQTCFCYPVCLSPAVDTLPWTVPAGSTIDICPGFFSDASSPGFAIEWVRIYQVGYENNADTLVFTANTGVMGIPVMAQPLVHIYPNPFVSELHIRVSTGGADHLDIYDSKGGLVHSADCRDQGEVRLDLGDLPAGIYLVRFSGAEISSYTHWVIKR